MFIRNMRGTLPRYPDTLTMDGKTYVCGSMSPAQFLCTRPQGHTHLHEAGTSRTGTASCVWDDDRSTDR